MNFRKKLSTLVILSFVFCKMAMAQSTDKELKIETRVNDLLKQMTLEEKVDYISGMRQGGHGPGKWDGTKGNKRLGIPPFKIYHGPYGVNEIGHTKKHGTYYPVSLNMACTWNTELVKEAQVSLGKELRAAGGQSNAGPAMNIIRDLRGGRSSEYFTEDPYLNGKIATAFVKGLQSQGHFAIMKHYLCNNQERNRNFIDVRVSERALREIYFPGFKAAVKEGNVLGVMTGYNLLNGYKTCDNQHIIKDVLKDEWGFKGIVMTDWTGSGKSAESMIKAGLDFEMPRADKFRKEKVLDALKKGKISEKEIDEQVRRVLYVTFKTGVVDNPPVMNTDLMATDENVAMARTVAEESMVLLKNEKNLLPLDRNQIKRIAVIGPNGAYGSHFRNGQKSYQMFQGGGSATVSPEPGRMITPLAGIKTKAGNNIAVSFEPGCYGEHGTTIINSDYLKTKNDTPGLDAEYFATNDLKGKGVAKVDKKISFIWHKAPKIIEQGNDSQGGSDDAFSVKWRGKLVAPKSRNYTFELDVLGIARLYINGKLIVNKYKPSRRDKFAMGNIYLEQGKHDIRVEYQKTERRNQLQLLWDYGNDAYLAKALQLAKDADVVVMPVGTSGKYETEGSDRDENLNRTESLCLSVAQENLIKEISKVNKNVVVVTYTAGVIMEQWREKVNSIIYAGFPGQEGGNALSKIIFGEVNPSGKLTVSIPKSLSQFPKDFYSYDDSIIYNEGIYVGYRYFDKHRLSPAFAFGHGLSYTSFAFKNLKLPKKVKAGEPVKVKVSITNSGKVKGKEVVQLYINDPESSEHRPLKELKAFKKVELVPGETKEIEFVLDADAFSFYSEKEDKWVLEPGIFNIWIGASSDAIKLKGKLTIVD